MPIKKKKAAPKKRTVKKSVRKSHTKAPEPLKPLKSFESFDIKRKGEIVLFGCGSVRVNRNDINLVAKMKESTEYLEGQKALKRLVKATEKDHWNTRTHKEILDIPSKTLRRIAGN